MNTAYPRTTQQLSQELPPPDTTPQKRSALAWLRSPLWLCLLVALIARLWLIAHSQGLVGSDEALVGVQAIRTLKGDPSIYLYGQLSLGSLPAFLVVPFFALFGATEWTLRAGALILSLLLVCLSWLLAGALATGAKLSPGARRRFQIGTALLAALPPLYDGVVALRVWGGYSETFVFTLLLLYWAVRLTQRWSQDMGLGESILRWLGIGLVAGLAYWTNPLSELPLQICALWLVGATFVSLRKARRNGSSLRTTLRTLGRSWLMAIYAIPAALLGFAPALYWGYRNHWMNIKYMLKPEQYPTFSNAYMSASYVTNFGQIQKMTSNYLTCDASRALSGLPATTSPQGNVLTQLLHPQNPAILAYNVVLIIMLVCTSIAILLYLLSYVLKNIAFVRRLLTLPLLFGAGVTAFFCLTNLTTLSLTSGSACSTNQAGDYGSLLMLALPFLVGAVFTLISIGGDQAANRQQYLPTANGAQVLRRGRSTLSPTGLAIRGILVVMLVLYLGSQIIAYATVSGDSYFRSQSCKVSLVQTDQVIAHLQKEQIHYLWSNVQTGSVLTFKTEAEVITADPRIFTDQLADFMPNFSSAVNKAQHASIAFLVAHIDDLPDRLKLLDAGQIKYNAARFTVDQGIDMVIVTPVDYTFQPTEAKALVASGLSC
jgi:hypothetical protein